MGVIECEGQLRIQAEYERPHNYYLSSSRLEINANTDGGGGGYIEVPTIN